MLLRQKGLLSKARDSCCSCVLSGQSKNMLAPGVNILETQPIIIGEQFQILGMLGKSFWVSLAKTEYLVPRL